MCEILKTFFMILILNCDIYYAYNKDKLLRLEFRDRSNKNYKYENNILEFTERVAKYGYESEKHTIVTEDGYILTTFRLLKRTHCVKLKQPPIILQHGLCANCMSWLDSGPKAGLAYLLADECYDLWLPNSRGTEFSRSHTKLNPDSDPEYWQFSFHEMGLYDFPATIDYILNKTGVVKINHISHSQGGTEFLVMASLRPEYLEKVHVAIAIAPGAWTSHTRWDLQLLAQYWRLIGSLLDIFGIQEVLHRHSIIQESALYLCQSESFYAKKICSFLVSNLDGPHEGSISIETQTILFAHTLDGVSLKNLVHVAQMISSKEFRQFDYEDENFKYYGRKTPPKYKLSHINVPMPIIYSDNDHLVRPEDVKIFRKHFKNISEVYRIPKSKWNHIDSIWSKDVSTVLFPIVNQLLTNYTYTERTNYTYTESEN